MKYDQKSVSILYTALILIAFSPQQTSFLTKEEKAVSEGKKIPAKLKPALNHHETCEHLKGQRKGHLVTQLCLSASAHWGLTGHKPRGQALRIHSSPRHRPATSSSLFTSYFPISLLCFLAMYINAILLPPSPSS